MTPEESVRLRELLKTDGDGHEAELDRLLSARQRERHAMIPRPMCCKAARLYPTILFEVDCYDGDTQANEGHWTTAKISDFDRFDPEYFTREDAFPRPKFCPYCGTALPAMRRKAVVSPSVCRVTDGGYYCDTCKERLHICLCDPCQSAFEAVP